METHDRQFIYRVVVFNSMFPNLCGYHSSRVISVEQIGTAIKYQWPLTTHKVSEIITPVHHEQQNLQLSNFSQNSFGACTCAHSSHPHLTAKDRKNAAANATTPVQQANSMTVTIRITKLKVRKRYIPIRDGRTGYPNPHCASFPFHSRYCRENCGKSIPSSTRTNCAQIPMSGPA